jgi:hypothetical protein
MCCKHIRVFIEKLAVWEGDQGKGTYSSILGGIEERLHSTSKCVGVLSILSIREGSTDMFQEHFMDKYTQKVHFQPFCTATTLVKFRKISSTQSCGSVLSSYGKWPILCKRQKFQFFTASPLKIRACGIERKCVEYN